MKIFVLILIYIVSIISLRYLVRYCAKDGMLSIRNAKVHEVWFMPIFNSIIVIGLLFLMMIIYFIRKFEDIEIKSTFWRKFFNLDL